MTPATRRIVIPLLVAGAAISVLMVMVWGGGSRPSTTTPAPVTETAREHGMTFTLSSAEGRGTVAAIAVPPAHGS